jgi:hypothetical protein
MKNTFLFLTLFLACGAFAYGQTAEELRTKLKSVPDGKSYNVRYDKVYKITRLRSAPIKTLKPDETFLALVAIFETNTLKKTIQTFYLRFPFNYGMSTFPRNLKMYLLIDGEKIELEDGSFSSDQYMNGMPIGGQIDFRVSRDLVERMANAKEVILNFKTKDRTLDDKARQTFRDMLELTNVR